MGGLEADRIRWLDPPGLVFTQCVLRHHVLFCCCHSTKRPLSFFLFRIIYKKRHSFCHKPVWLCTRVYMFSMASMHNTAFFGVRCTILRLRVASSGAMHPRRVPCYLCSFRRSPRPGRTPPAHAPAGAAHLDSPRMAHFSAGAGAYAVVRWEPPTVSYAHASLRRSVGLVL